jgi:hypothetical protein
MVVNVATGERQFLYRCYNAKDSQPYEVQPSISPDGRWVLMKDGRTRRVIAVELDEHRMQAFLR